MPKHEAQTNFLWKKVRETAKRGLEDPSCLTKLDELLRLPVVQTRAKTSDSLGRARALIEVLTELLDDLCKDASPRRVEAIRCLFMLDPDWKGKKISRRREHLAGVKYQENTRTFVRDEENPLWEELATLLVERSLAIENSKSHSSSQRDGGAALADELCAAVARCHRVVTTYLFQPQVRSDEASLFCYSALLVKWNDFPRLLPPKESGLLDELFPSSEAHLDFHISFAGLGNHLTPFCDQDLEILRNQYRNAVPEAMVFFDFLDSKRGKSLLRTWRTWLDECECVQDEPPRADCKVHRVLGLWADFLSFLEYEPDLSPRLIDTW